MYKVLTFAAIAMAAFFTLSSKDVVAQEEDYQLPCKIVVYADDIDMHKQAPVHQKDAFNRLIGVKSGELGIDCPVYTRNSAEDWSQEALVIIRTYLKEGDNSGELTRSYENVYSEIRYYFVAAR